MGKQVQFGLEIEIDELTNSIKNVVQTIVFKPAF
jgi:hypothetical protein